MNNATSDLQMLKDRVTGLTEKIKSLRLSSDQLNRLAGLETEEMQVRKELSESDATIQALKEDISELQSKKAKSVGKSAKGLADTMSKILPTGEALFQITPDETVFIGWKLADGQVTPYHGLSGGQRIAFDMALAYALLSRAKTKILIMEAAEVDDTNLSLMLNHMTKNATEDMQIIINTCHEPSSIPDGWAVTRL